MTSTSLSIVIPTFNEPDLVRQTVDSLKVEPWIRLEIVIANAGDPLPKDLAERVHEVRISSDNFWTGSTEAGLDFVRHHPTDYVMLLNCDTPLLPGSIEKEIEFVGDRNDVVACCPAYSREADGSLKLLYSHQSDLGFLLLGKLIRNWEGPEDSPSEPFPCDLHGGQGMLFRTELLDRFELDVRHFPHYAADHDLWLSMRKEGIRLWVIPQAGAINERGFGVHSRKSLRQKVQGLWKRFTSPLMSESATTMWRLRSKHLPLRTAIPSFLLAFGLRWTVGLPKILKRL